MGLFQMYGRYTKDLGEYAKDEARKLKILERRRKQEDKIRNKVSETYTPFDMPLHLFLFEIQTPSFYILERNRLSSSNRFTLNVIGRKPVIAAFL